MSFQEIRGQDRAIQILQQDLKYGHLVGSYLFSGPEGVGKNLVAKTLAKLVNCQEEGSDSCNRCASCLKIESNNHPDVHFIDSQDSSAIKIEEIRQLQKDISLKSYEGRFKVFIINNAHNLTPEAANALLKILEEPPKDSLIILITSKSNLLFRTIISRCKIIKFYPLKRVQLEEILNKDYSLDNNQAHFLAYFCEGRIGNALRLKEQDILRERNRVVDEFVFSRKQDLENSAKINIGELRQYLNILAGWFRDIYLIKIGMPHNELINLDRKMELIRYMNRYTLLDLDEILNCISDTLLYLGQNINIKLLISNLKWALR